MLLFMDSSACIQWANGRHPILEVKSVSKIKLRANRMNKTHILGGVTAILFRLMYHVTFAVIAGFYVNEDNMRRFVGRSKITDCQSIGYTLQPIEYSLLYTQQSFLLWPNLEQIAQTLGLCRFYIQHCNTLLNLEKN